MTHPQRMIPAGLLEAARRDGPDAARRSRIWEGVAAAPQLALVGSAGSLLPAAPVAVPHVTSAAAFSAGKLLLAGALAGSVLTLGVGAMLLHSAPRERDRLVTVPHAQPKPPHEVASRATPASVSTSMEVDEPALDPGSAAPLVPTPGRRVVTAAKPSFTSDERDVLMHEVALVGGARAELMKGDAASALALLDAAGHGTSHSLEPEELALRARALRALGRETEATRVEAKLRSRYPDSFLSR